MLFGHTSLTSHSLLIPLGTPIIDNFIGWNPNNAGIIYNGTIYPKYHGPLDDINQVSSNFLNKLISVGEYGYLRVSYTLIFGCDISEYTDDIDLLWGHDYYKTYHWVNGYNYTDNTNDYPLTINATKYIDVDQQYTYNNTYSYILEEHNDTTLLQPIYCNHTNQNLQAHQTTWKIQDSFTIPRASEIDTTTRFGFTGRFNHSLSYDKYWTVTNIVFELISELCHPQHWFLPTINWYFTDCYIQSIGTSISNNDISLISNKQFINYDSILLIEFVYKVNNVIDSCDNGTIGVVVYNLPQSCDYYYIGVNISRNPTDMNTLFIDKEFEGEYTQLWQQSINQSDGFNFSRDHRLKMEIDVADSETLFDVYFDDVLIVNGYTDTNSTASRYDSGPIGLKNVQLNVTGKLLYITGTESSYTQSCFPTNAPTTTPTNMPTDTTLNPSSFPTNNPTDIPTDSPTENPTKNPSFLPTINPSFNPTANPSQTPTSNPSSNPTSIPSFNPSETPTVNPSLNLTFGPSQLPSFIPSKIPSESPSYPVSPTNMLSLTPSNNPIGTDTRKPSLPPSVAEKYGIKLIITFEYKNNNTNQTSQQIEILLMNITVDTLEAYLKSKNISTCDSTTTRDIAVSIHQYYSNQTSRIMYSTTINTTIILCNRQDQKQILIVVNSSNNEIQKDIIDELKDENILVANDTIHIKPTEIYVRNTEYETTGSFIFNTFGIQTTTEPISMEKDDGLFNITTILYMTAVVLFCCVLCVCCFIINKIRKTNNEDRKKRIEYEHEIYNKKVRKLKIQNKDIDVGSPIEIADHSPASTSSAAVQRISYNNKAFPKAYLDVDNSVTYNQYPMKVKSYSRTASPLPIANDRKVSNVSSSIPMGVLDINVDDALREIEGSKTKSDIDRTPNGSYNVNKNNILHALTEQIEDYNDEYEYYDDNDDYYNPNVKNDEFIIEAAEKNNLNVTPYLSPLKPFKKVTAGSEYNYSIDIVDDQYVL